VIEVEAEDYAGNIAYKTVWIKYEPIIPTPTPIITIPPPIPILTPPYVEMKYYREALEYLDVEIEPKYCEASPGEVINYEIILDWAPHYWRGEVKAKVILEAAGLRRSGIYLQLKLIRIHL